MRYLSEAKRCVRLHRSLANILVRAKVHKNLVGAVAFMNSIKAHVGTA